MKKKAKAIEYIRGVPVFNLNADELNSNWLATARLENLASLGVPQAQDLLKILNEAPTYRGDNESS